MLLTCLLGWEIISDSQATASVLIKNIWMTIIDACLKIPSNKDWTTQSNKIHTIKHEIKNLNKNDVEIRKVPHEYTYTTIQKFRVTFM